MYSTRYRFFLTNKLWPVCLGHSGQVWRERAGQCEHLATIAEQSLHAAVSFPLTIPHTVRHKQRSLVKPPVLCQFPLGHIKQSFLVSSHMHGCFSIRWKCSDVLIECFAVWINQNLLCLNHNASIGIPLKTQAPLFLCALFFSFFFFFFLNVVTRVYGYYGHVVERMYANVWERTDCWCLRCCSANERLGGFRVSGAGALRGEVSDRAHE